MFQTADLHASLAEAIEKYATVHWARHVPTFNAFGVTTHGIWTECGTEANRLIALISYPSGADPAALAAEVMASPEFMADMNGFDPHDIVSVDSVLVDPTTSSPMSSPIQ